MGAQAGKCLSLDRSILHTVWAPCHEWSLLTLTRDDKDSRGVGLPCELYHRHRRDVSNVFSPFLTFGGSQ